MEIRMTLRGGRGKRVGGRRPAGEVLHEVTCYVYDDDTLDGGPLVEVGYSDGSDWPDVFSRAEWEAFNRRVLAAFTAAEQQRDLDARQ